MIISLDVFDRIEEWTPVFEFYAWDVSVPGTVGFSLQHMIPSIYSTARHIRRHRLCTLYPSMPWEFRQYIFTFPCELEEISLDFDGSLLAIATTDS